MSALSKMRERAAATRRRERGVRDERREKNMEAVGALVVLPLFKQLTVNIPLFEKVKIDEKLQVAGVSLLISMYTKGRLHELAWGSALGAAGAFSWESEGLLKGLFGK